MVRDTPDTVPYGRDRTAMYLGVAATEVVVVVLLWLVGRFFTP